MNTREIGAKGERTLHLLLPGSEWVNAQGDRRLPYDIIWEGIKIDVKTCSGLSSDKPSFYMFPAKIGVRYNGVVLVFVALREKDNLFWTDKCHKGVKTCYKVKTALPVNVLPVAIRMAATKEVATIKDVDESSNAKLKSINLDIADHELAKRLAIKLTERYRQITGNIRLHEVTVRAAIHYALIQAARELGIE